MKDAWFDALNSKLGIPKDIYTKRTEQDEKGRYFYRKPQ
jgi:hypothetical protein